MTAEQHKHKFTKRDALLAGALIASAWGPFQRRITHKKEVNPKSKFQELDQVRLLVAGIAVGELAKQYILPHLAKDGESLEQSVKRLVTEGHDFKYRGVKLFHLRGEYFVLGALASGLAGYEALHMLENRRKTESLATTDQKVTQVKQLYESEVARQTTVTIDGQKVAVNGAQERAQTYATKFLGELRAAAKDPKAFDRDLAAARKSVASVFAGDNQAAKEAAVRVTGDAFESITDREIR